jgi:hypothetical protein
MNEFGSFFNNYSLNKFGNSDKMNGIGDSSVPMSNIAKIIEFGCFLEGMKTKVKDMHWASETLINYYSDAIHRRLDDYLEDVQEYQDALIEISSGEYGSISVNDIKSVEIPFNDPIGFLDFVKEKSLEFYKGLEDICLVGIKAETEVFIGNTQRKKYLFKLCRK